MRFGIFYEHQNPRPWTERRSEHSLLKDALAQTELADRLEADLAERTIVLDGNARLRMVPGRLRMPQ